MSGENEVDKVKDRVVRIILCGGLCGTAARSVTTPTEHRQQTNIELLSNAIWPNSLVLRVWSDVFGYPMYVHVHLRGEVSEVSAGNPEDPALSCVTKWEIEVC